MKKLNRVLSVLLALSLCASLLSVAALAGGETDELAGQSPVQTEQSLPAPAEETKEPAGEDTGSAVPDDMQNESLTAPQATDAEPLTDAAGFAARLVETLKNNVLTDVNQNGNSGKPGSYLKDYDPYILRLEAVIVDSAAAYQAAVDTETWNAEYEALKSYSKINSSHDNAIIALLARVIAAGTSYTHTVTGEMLGTGGRPISDGKETFYTYCSEYHFAYPAIGTDYAEGEAIAEVNAVSAKLVRALEAGYPLDSYGLSRYYDEMVGADIGMGMSTQQVIWDILAGKSAPSYTDAYSAALFTYATTDQALERVDTVTVTAEPESPVALVYDETTGSYAGTFTLDAERYVAITAVEIPGNAEVRCTLPNMGSHITPPLTGSTVLIPGSTVTLTVDGGAERVEDMRFSYVSYEKVGDDLTSFRNYDVVYDGGSETGKPYQTMIGFAMEEVKGALDVAFTLTGKPGEPEEPERTTGALTLEKVFAGAEVTAPGDLTFTVESDNGAFETRTLTLADFTLTDGVYACTLKELPLGTYTFTERNAGVADYDLTVTYAVDGAAANSASAALTEETASAALRITNTYTRTSGGDDSEPPYEPPYVPPYVPPVTPVDPTPTPVETPVVTPEVPVEEIDIPEEDTPLADRPEQPPEPTLPDEPTGEIIIVDETVPMGGLPQTGTVDAGAVALRDGLMMFFVLLSALSLAGLAVCVATRKR